MKSTLILLLVYTVAAVLLATIVPELQLKLFDDVSSTFELYLKSLSTAAITNGS